MYDHLQRRFEQVISRLGREVALRERTETAADGFNNPTDSWSDAGTRIRCVRTYPNRNTEVVNTAGDLHRDRPVFAFTADEAPGEEARIVYPEDAETVENASTTTLYEMKAPTRYDSHVEMFGEVVTNP
jgi:hypothetical protein